MKSRKIYAFDIYHTGVYNGSESKHGGAAYE